MAPMAALRVLLVAAAWPLSRAAPVVRKEASVVTHDGRVVRPVEARAFFDNASAPDQAIDLAGSGSSPPAMEAALKQPALEQPAPASATVAVQVEDVHGDNMTIAANVEDVHGDNMTIAANVEDFANLTDIAMAEQEGGRVSRCIVSGDPHILTFDATAHRGHYWHPMFSPGHWWLVRTQGDQVSIQAKYGKCGWKNGGGWMAARHKGVPRCCIGGFFIGGKFLRAKDGTEHRLVIEAPCDWDWDHSQCRTHQRHPRVFWMGVNHESSASSVETLTTFTRADPAVRVNMHGNKMDIYLPLGIRVELYMWGHWRHGSAAHMNAIITMKQGSAGGQCGHCGMFDGNWGNDRIYQQTGELNTAVAKRVLKGDEKRIDFCDANVKCPDRMGPAEGKCKANAKAVAFDFSKCNGKVLEQAKQACAKAFKKTHDIANWMKHTEVKACVEDECTGKGFAKADAEEAKILQKEQR